MLRNYVLVALRNLTRHRLYSLINLGGLAVGLAACLLILLYVLDELSFERWLPGAERVAVIETEFRVPGRETMAFGATPGPVRAALEKELGSELEQVTRLYETEQALTVGDRSFLAQVGYADANFLQVLGLPARSGDLGAALASPRAIALTETLARKLFGSAPALGKVVSLESTDGKLDFTVTAVLADLPKTTHLALEALALFEPARYAKRPWISEQWTAANMRTYVRSRSAASLARVAAALPGVVDRNAHLDVPGWENVPPSRFLRLAPMPLLDIHLHSHKGGYSRLGDFSTVLGFAAIAVLILGIACINFVNLATARAMQRAREVSLRKVLGATRGQLVLQHLGEAVVTALVALLGAFALVELALPAFAAFLHKHLVFSYSDPRLMLAALALVLVVGVAGGLYPALYLSRFRPAVVLKANKSSASGSTSLRGALVVFQFAVSIALIICTVTVLRQTGYARALPLGFAPAGRVAISGVNALRGTQPRQTFKRAVAALPGVTAAALSSDRPPLSSSSNALVFQTADLSGQQLLVEQLTVDWDFLSAYEVRPLAGRLFSAEFPGDLPVESAPGKPGAEAVVVNLALARKLGKARPEELVGETLWRPDGDDKLVRVTVVGVVEDLHLRSLRDALTPMYFVLGSEQGMSELTVVTEPGRAQEVLRGAEDLWRRMVAGVPMSSSFIEQDLRAQYDGDQQRGQLLAAFAGFAVLIACLGLFGLAAFSAERRTKEIGMRKVLGASVWDIVRLLVWQFSRPVLWANLIAWPAAFLLMQRWLGGFRYAIDLTSPLVFAPIFLGAGVSALAIAWLTTAGHAYRVARGRPGQALRYE